MKTVQDVCEILVLCPNCDVDWFRARVILSGADLSPRGQRGLDLLLDNRMTLTADAGGYALYTPEVPLHLGGALGEVVGDDFPGLLERLGEWAEGNQ